MAKAGDINPANRFASLKDFSAALNAIADKSSDMLRSETDDLTTTLQTVDLAEGSLHGGMLGAVWVAYRRAILSGDGKAMVFADKILRRIDKTDFRDIALGSPLFDYRGVLIMRARLAYLRHDVVAARKALDELAPLILVETEKAELFGGSAGMLAALAAFVEDYRIYDDRVGDLLSPLAALLDTHLEHIRQTLEDLAASKPVHLGMAHGLAGLTYACLRAERALEIPTSTVVMDALNLTITHAKPVGEGVAWPGTLNAGNDDVRTLDFAPGWCSGSAGYVYLWCAAYRATGSVEFLQFAEKTGIHVWEHPGSGANLCCGLAGRALSLQHLATYTNRQKWAGYARILADRSGLHKLTNDAPDGALFRGNLGLIYALQEMSDLESASAFPLF